jgi:hypothetical protein
MHDAVDPDVAGVGSPSAQSRAPSQPNIGQALESAPRDELKELQGIVQTVDRETRVLRVAHQPTDSILLMTDDSQVKTQSRLGSLADIQRGTRIKASYQDRYGIKVARQIEITE